jgi:exodeoxyribonuclease-5
MALLTLSDLQERGVIASRDWFRDVSASGITGDAPDFLLTGVAGTGKSTMLPMIVEACAISPEFVAFCAPTGKAAKVMTAKLKDFGIETRARTIHSYIYRPKALKAEVLERNLDALKAHRAALLERLKDHPNANKDPDLIDVEKSILLTEKDLDKAYDNVEGPKFSLNPDSDIRKMRLVMVDEGSMVGETIADDLRSFGVPILVIGDPGQLPPVAENPGFLNRDPDFFLDEIHRQAQDNPIIRLSVQARAGKELKPGRYAGAHDDEWAEVVMRGGDRVTYDLDRDAQILVGTNRKRWFITHKLRKALGYTTTGPCAGEPLIVCKNSRSIPDLVNGSFVQCVESVGNLEEGEAYVVVTVEDEFSVTRPLSACQGVFEEHLFQKKGAASAPKARAFRSRIDGEQLDWGWVITVHKSQGSQWDEVVVHDESGMFHDDAAKHLYTAVTRAAKRLTVVV